VGIVSGQANCFGGEKRANIKWVFREQSELNCLRCNGIVLMIGGGVCVPKETERLTSRRWARVGHQFWGHVKDDLPVEIVLLTDFLPIQSRP